MDKEPERYYDWMLWKLRQEPDYPDGYSREWCTLELPKEEKLGIDKAQEVKNILV